MRYGVSVDEERFREESVIAIIISVIAAFRLMTVLAATHNQWLPLMTKNWMTLIFTPSFDQATPWDPSTPTPSCRASLSASALAPVVCFTMRQGFSVDGERLREEWVIAVISVIAAFRLMTV